MGNKTGKKRNTKKENMYGNENKPYGIMEN